MAAVVALCCGAEGVFEPALWVALAVVVALAGVVVEALDSGVVFSAAAALLFTAVSLDNFLSLLVDVFAETAPALGAFVAAGFLDEGLLAIGSSSVSFTPRLLAAAALTGVVLVLPLAPCVLAATFVFSAILWSRSLAIYAPPDQKPSGFPAL